MIIYLAGTTILPERERGVLSIKQDRLNSYFYIKDPDQIQHEAFHANLPEHLVGDIPEGSSWI